MKFLLIITGLFIYIFTTSGQNIPEIVLSNREGLFPLVLENKATSILIDSSEAEVVKIAAQALSSDINLITGVKPVVSFETKDNYLVIAGTIGHSKYIEQIFGKLRNFGVDKITGKWESFVITTLDSPFKGIKKALVVVGSDARGTAYGLFELSRMAGVSPWVWWADAMPQKSSTLCVTPGTLIKGEPSVKYRGIFINDEDWGILPWSNLTYEVSDDKSRIGPRTNERIFELLLRLHANTYWPAMHPCTLPFFMTEGNRAVAEKYGIFIGASHCEPMACNAAGEWSRRGVGDYDYVHNSSEVYKFWEDRVKEVSGQNILYTLGMRGVHDGQMQGAKTVSEQKAVLTKVFEDQREILKKYVNKDLNRVPQVFVPYKEILDVYNAGLQVPDDVTLMWCDDNYGYITHFPNESELARKGGNGVYYHASYWGRPHDYLWIGSTSPALIFQQMNLAYNKGIQDIWILNVGDIKPAEYPMELFLDMAWNIEAVRKIGVKSHQSRFLEREFGSETASQLGPVMEEYNRLNYIRKPEFMGNTREEEKNPDFKKIKDLPWGELTLRNRLNSFKELSDKVEQISLKISPEKKDAYFQLVKYPVQAASQMNRKLLTAQLARHGKADWAESDAAFDSIASLTKVYNNAKWNRMMDFQPRKLPVFNRVKHDTIPGPLEVERTPVVKRNGTECSKGTPVLYEGLGYEGKAAGITKGSTLTYTFENLQKDSLEIEIRLLPNYPVNGDKLRFTLSLDGNSPETISYETKGRSEEWKLNVLSNQAIRRITVPLSKSKFHLIEIEALDEGIVVDQIMLY
jgi:hypothetical protein